MKSGYENGDSMLIDDCLTGNADAWAFFTKKYSDLITLSIRARLKKYGLKPSVEEVEDLRQTVLKGLWDDKKFKNIRNRENISYWLAITAGNIATECMRQKARSEDNVVFTTGDIESDYASEIEPACQSNPRDAACRGEFLDKLHTAMRSLDPKEKLILKMGLLHGKKYREISDILKLPPGTVSSYLKRAKNKVRKALKDYNKF